MTSTPATRHLADLVSEDGDLDLAQLPELLGDGPVEIGVLTDEELHWFGPDPDADPDPQVDAPRLGRLDPEARATALDTAFWMLQARGELALEEDRPGEVLRVGLRALGVALRNSAAARCTVTLHRDGGEHRAAVWGLPGVGYLTEAFGETGLHHLVLRDLDDQAAWLAQLLDARTAGTGDVQRQADPEQLAPPLSVLRADATAELRCVLAVRDATGDGGHLRIVHLLTGDRGTHAVRQHADATGAEQTVVQPLEPGEVAPLLAAFLDEATAPGDVPLPATTG